jgi:hypothetical protein
MLVGTGVAYASHQFADVPDSNFFHDEIDFLASRGITTGCGGGNFCPKDNVTREQMAAFIYRMADALSPTVLHERGPLDAARGPGNCQTDPHVAPFEQLATATGGFAATGSSGSLFGRIQVRINGGGWTDVLGAWNMPDGAEGHRANSTTTGYLLLNPGDSYEFSLDTNSIPTASNDRQCQLLVVIEHRMPGGLTAGALTPETAPVEGSSN